MSDKKPNNPNMATNTQVTLRDHFAGLAMQAIIAGHMASGGKMLHNDTLTACESAYDIANKMLTERENPTP